MTRKRSLLWLPICVTTAFACSSQQPDDVTQVTSALTTSDVLGFEHLSDWTVVQGTATLSLSTVHTQGSFSLAVTNPNGFIVFQSRALANTQIGTITNTVGLDVQIPTVQPNPFYKGAVQLYIEIPSKNLFNAFVAQVELTPLTNGVFHHVTF